MGYKFATRTRKNIKVLVEIMAEAEQLMSTNVSRHFKKKSCFMINLQHGIYFTRVENQRPIFYYPSSLFSAPFTTTTSYYPLPVLEHLVRAHSSEKPPLPYYGPAETCVFLE